MRWFDFHIVTHLRLPRLRIDLFSDLTRWLGPMSCSVRLPALAAARAELFDRIDPKAPAVYSGREVSALVACGSISSLLDRSFSW